MYKDDTEMFLPVVEFLASFLFIRMYREQATMIISNMKALNSNFQYLALFSCYAFYKDDKDGELLFLSKTTILFKELWEFAGLVDKGLWLFQHQQLPKWLCNFNLKILAYGHNQYENKKFVIDD
jgi:hypothetical protein